MGWKYLIRSKNKWMLIEEYFFGALSYLSLGQMFSSGPKKAYNGFSLNVPLTRVYVCMYVYIDKPWPF